MYSSFLPPVFNYASLVKLQGQSVKVYRTKKELNLMKTEFKQKSKYKKFK